MLRVNVKMPDFKGIQRAVDRYRDDLWNIVHEALEEATLYGEDRMIEILESAFTKTGMERAARGGHPGRIETGTMRDAISSDVYLLGQTKLSGEWGWLNEVEDYFLAQENGAGLIPAMSALQGSFVSAKALFLKRLKDAGLRL